MTNSINEQGKIFTSLTRIIYFKLEYLGGKSTQMSVQQRTIILLVLMKNRNFSKSMSRNF